VELAGRIHVGLWELTTEIPVSTLCYQREPAPGKPCSTCATGGGNGDAAAERPHTKLPARRNMKYWRWLGMALAVMAGLGVAAAQSQWQRLMNSPRVNVGAMALLTDGTVIAHEEDDVIGNLATRNWYKLTPDLNGSYVNGTWTQIAPLPSGYGPLYFGSAVLRDGRYLVEGGEDNQYGRGETNLGAIYDSVADSWTSVNPPNGWENIGDASTAVLGDGTFMLADGHRHLASFARSFYDDMEQHRLRQV
jgi:hypothetical protein